MLVSIAYIGWSTFWKLQTFVEVKSEPEENALDVLFSTIFKCYFIGLHDIGKWNDIDIGVQYCDIDITHDIYAFYGNVEHLLNALNINIHEVWYSEK